MSAETGSHGFPVRAAWMASMALTPRLAQNASPRRVRRVLARYAVRPLTATDACRRELATCHGSGLSLGPGRVCVHSAGAVASGSPSPRTEEERRDDAHLRPQ